MKYVFLILGVVSLLTSCKDKTIYCTSIGDSIKSWSVYKPNDSINMTDEFGNDTSFVISYFKDSQPYTAIERAAFLKKLVECEHFQTLRDSSQFFKIQINSTAANGIKSGKVYVKNPSSYDFQLNVGDLYGVFSVHSSEEVNVNSFNGLTSYEWNYVVGNTTYPEAILCNQDTTGNNFNVYQFVYAKNKGLVQFSTRSPQRTWTVD